jgi:hypothetical protein
MTPQVQNVYLYSEFLKVGNVELGSEILQNPQIAEDALEILERQDDETALQLVPSSQQNKLASVLELSQGTNQVVQVAPFTKSFLKFDENFLQEIKDLL